MPDNNSALAGMQRIICLGLWRSPWILGGLAGFYMGGRLSPLISPARWAMAMATKIIGGKFRNMTLATPRGKVVRPTLGRIRENLFNLLREQVAGADFLDLYAGLGAVGLEALSRGARRCVFVENASPCLAAISRNIARLKVEKQSEVVRVSCFRALDLLARRGEKFDCLFADPPYSRGWARRVLDAVESSGLWRANAIFVLQTERQDYLLPAATGALTLERRADYGATSLWLYRPAKA